MEATAPKVETIGDVNIILLPGENLDASNTKEFKLTMAAVLQGKRKVVFDMSNLRFVDSSGLGAFLSCLKMCDAAGGDLKLFGMTKSVRALFELVRMHRVFDIFNTKEEAVRAFLN